MPVAYRHTVDDAIGDHNVRPTILDRQLFKDSLTELDVR